VRRNFNPITRVGVFCLISVFSCLMSALDHRTNLVVLALAFLLALRVRDVEVRDCFRAMCVLRSVEVGSEAIVRRIREFHMRGTVANFACCWCITRKMRVRTDRSCQYAYDDVSR
jgi:hypothetical protein